MATEAITGEFLNKLKVGDRVWVGKAEYRKNARLLPVLSRTRTIIRVQGHDFRIVQWEYDGSWHACETPARMFGDSILGVATPHQAKEYDAEQLRKQRERDDFEAAKKARENKRAELRELFSPDHETNTVYVHDAEWTAQREEGKFDVTFHGLTEAEVRELAKKIKVSG